MGTTWAIESNTKASSTGSVQDTSIILDAAQSFLIKNSSASNILTLGEATGNLAITGDLTISGGNITNALTLDSTLACQGDVTVNNSTITCISTNESNTSDPRIDLYNNEIDPNNGGVTDSLGSIRFFGNNASGDDEQFGGMSCVSKTITDGSEDGQLRLKVMSAGSQNTVFVKGTGQSDGTVDVDIGNGAASKTTIKGDLEVEGNDIQSSSATALTLSGADVQVVGDLTVTGNDIKSSGGTTAITLSGNDVTIADALTVTGTLYFGNQEYISNASDGFIILGTGNSANVGVAILSPGAGYDSNLILYEGATPRWSIGQDASDNTDYSLSFDANTATVGGAQKMKLASDGDLTIAGDLTITGGNITSATTFDSTTTFSAAVNVGVAGTGYDVTFYGDNLSKNLLWDQSANALHFADSTYLRMGNESAGDFRMYHTGGDMTMRNDTGDLTLDCNDNGTFSCDSGGKITLGQATSTVDVLDDLDVGGDISIDGNLTFTEAATITLKDNNNSSLNIGSTGQTNLVKIATSDYIETVQIHCDTRLIGSLLTYGFANIKLDGAAAVSGSQASYTSMTGGIRFESVVYTNTSGTNTLGAHSYFAIETPSITNTSGTLTITDTVLLTNSDTLTTANSMFTNTDKTGNAKSGTMKIEVGGTIYHIQLYAS